MFVLLKAFQLLEEKVYKYSNLEKPADRFILTRKNSSVVNNTSKYAVRNITRNYRHKENLQRYNNYVSKFKVET